MAARVLMPKGSDTMTEGKVLKWLKQEGETVSHGDPVLEIETDKVDMEVEAMSAGVLRRILVAEGTTVPVGELLAVIAKADENISALLKPVGGKPEAEGAVPPPAAGRAASVKAASAPQVGPESAPGIRPSEDSPLPTPSSEATSMIATGGPFEAPGSVPARGRVLASPLARRMAEKMGVDLTRIVGTGPGGRIIRKDVERAAAQRAGARPPEGGPAPLTVGGTVTSVREPAPMPLRPTRAPEGPEFRDEPLSSMRKTIATRLTQSLGPVPHFYLKVEVDMKRVRELRESANTLDPKLKLSYNDIIVKACAAALRLHPEVNASFRGDAIRYHNRVHIGIAVAVKEGGLITPVIRDGDQKSLQQLAKEAKELIERARQRKLQPNEYTGATFTVSNLGMMGIEEFSAVINPPESAIIAVGAVIDKPVVTDGRIEIGTRCRLTLSCDHRVVDGATGAKFLQTIRRILENPVYLAF